MDNLAHTLAGAALGEAGLRRRTPLGMTTLLVAANLPDIDVLAIAFGNGLAFRRGWTHGVLAIVLLPLLLTAAMLAWDHLFRRRGRRSEREPARRRELLLLSFVGVISHPVLDWLNTYGMRWLMPFDGTWYYGDGLFIVDPWLWLILGIGVLFARRERYPRAGAVAILVAVIYAGGMVGSAVLGRQLVEEGVQKQDVDPADVLVAPVPLNPNRRQVVFRDGDRYLRGTLYWLPRPRLEVHEEAVDANWHHPMAMLAAEHPDAQQFLNWARLPFFVIIERELGFVVRIDDLRYSDGQTPSWAAIEIEFLARPGSNRDLAGSPSGRLRRSGHFPSGQHAQ